MFKKTWALYQCLIFVCVLSGLCSPSWGSYWSILWWSPFALPSSGGCASIALPSLAALLPLASNCSLWTFHTLLQFTDWDSFKIDLQARWPSLIAQRWMSSSALRHLLFGETLSIWLLPKKNKSARRCISVHSCLLRGYNFFSVH